MAGFLFVPFDRRSFGAADTIECRRQQDKARGYSGLLSNDCYRAHCRRAILS